MSIDSGNNRWLAFGAALSAAAALAHVGIVIGGSDWYRFFGAGEEFALLAADGHWLPAVVTLGIAAVLGVWSLYALSGAGMIRRLPLLRTVLLGMTAVYLLRGLALPLLLQDPSRSTTFWLWSSAICLGFGLVHALGLRQAWPGLASRAPEPALDGR